LQPLFTADVFSTTENVRIFAVAHLYHLIRGWRAMKGVLLLSVY